MLKRLLIFFLAVPVFAQVGGISRSTTPSSGDYGFWNRTNATIKPKTTTDTVFVNYLKSTGYVSFTSAIGTAADVWIRRVNPGRLVIGTTATDSGGTLTLGNLRAASGTQASPSIANFDGTTGFRFSTNEIIASANNVNMISIGVSQTVVPKLAFAFGVGYEFLTATTRKKIDIGASLSGSLTSVVFDSLQLFALSGATATASNLIPAGSLVLGVSVRNTTAITGAASYEIGDGTDADRWGTAIPVTINNVTSVAQFTITSPVYYTSTTSIVLTANTSNFTGGNVRIVVYYISLTGPTS